MKFGTVGSPIGTPKKPGGSPGAIQYISEIGLSALELGWVHSVRVTEVTCSLIKTTAQSDQVSISVHAPYFINLNSSDEEWPKSKKRLMDAAIYGNLAGATDIVFHPGTYFGLAPEVVLPKVIDRLSECVKELRVLNNPVVLRPETMGKSAMIGSIEDNLILSKEIPGVLPCIDFAHLHARAGDGTMNSKNEWDAVIDKYIKALGTDSIKHLHIHLSGIEYTVKGERNHLPIKESDFNVDALFESLRGYGCDGRILCESPILEEDASFLLDLWGN